MIKEIVACRLILRPWQESDAESLYKYAQDPAIGPIAGWPPHTSVEDSLNIIRTVFAAPETYAVVLKASDEPVGSVGIMFGYGLHSAEIQQGEAEIGYWIGKPYWGQGLIPEAVRCLLVMEKCGFRFHHTEEGKTSPLGDVRTEHFMRMTKEEWESAQHLSIRPLTEQDIPEMRELFRATVLTVNSKDYTKEEVEDWASCGDSVEHWKELFAKNDYVGALDGQGNIIGFSSMNAEGYLHSMFVHKDWQGKGVATLLLSEVEKMACGYGVHKISVEVSITARPFFEKRGYKVVKEQKARGNRFWLTNYLMEKTL